jgi:hypothetical protein
VLRDVPTVDPGTIQDAGPWAVALFVLLSVIAAILHGDLVPGWIHRRVEAERVALRAELDARNAESAAVLEAIAALAKRIPPTRRRAPDG